MTQTAREFERTFERAWILLLTNPLIVAACIVMGLLAAGAEYVTETLVGSYAISANGSPDALEAIAAARQIVVFVVTLAVSLVQMAYVTGMAGAAWRAGRATLGDGWSALSHRLGALAAAFALLWVMGVCAAVLAPITFMITLVIYALLFIYTIAAVVIGERPPIASVVQSASLALANVFPTLGVIAIVGIIAVAGGWLGNLIGGLNPEAGWLVTGLFQQIIVAYATLVVAGEYLNLASPSASAGS
jgi:hypothetical protein